MPPVLPAAGAETTSLVQVAYDIAHPRRLRRVDKALSAVGERVHDSLFVCLLSPAQLAALQRRLSRLVDLRQDSLRYTPLCARDRSRTRHLGTSSEPQVAGYWVC